MSTAEQVDDARQSATSSPYRETAVLQSSSDSIHMSAQPHTGSPRHENSSREQVASKERFSALNDEEQVGLQPKAMQQQSESSRATISDHLTSAAANTPPGAKELQGSVIMDGQMVGSSSSSSSSVMPAPLSIAPLVQARDVIDSSASQDFSASAPAPTLTGAGAGQSGAGAGQSGAAAAKLQQAARARAARLAESSAEKALKRVTTETTSTAHPIRDKEFGALHGRETAATAAALGAALQRPRRRLILPMVQLQQQALNPQDFGEDEQKSDDVSQHDADGKRGKTVRFDDLKESVAVAQLAAQQSFQDLRTKAEPSVSAAAAAAKIRFARFKDDIESEDENQTKECLGIGCFVLGLALTVILVIDLTPGGADIGPLHFGNPGASSS